MDDTDNRKHTDEILELPSSPGLQKVVCPPEHFISVASQDLARALSSAFRPVCHSARLIPHSTHSGHPLAQKMTLFHLGKTQLFMYCHCSTFGLHCSDLTHWTGMLSCC